VSEERDLSEVAADINRRIGYLEGSFQTAFSYAQEIGELLTEAKGRLAHGAFGPWVDENLHCTQRTARNYMKVYQERDLLKSENVSVLSDAYHFLIDKRQQESMDKEEAEREQRQQGYEKEREERNQERERQYEMFKVRCTGAKPEGWTDEWEKRWRLSGEYSYVNEFVADTLFPKRRHAKDDIKEYMRERWGIEWLDEQETYFQKREEQRTESFDWKENIRNAFLGKDIGKMFGFGNPSASLEDYGLADPELDKEQGKLFSVMEQYLDRFSDPHRKLNAIQNAMIWLRRYGNKMQQEIGRQDGGEA
jgi:hypothetical protein